jgi:hypothetical protein
LAHEPQKKKMGKLFLPNPDPESVSGFLSEIGKILLTLRRLHDFSCGCLCCGELGRKKGLKLVRERQKEKMRTWGTHLQGREHRYAASVAWYEVNNPAGLLTMC